MNNFELEDWEDINQNGGTIGTGINKAIHKLVVSIFNSGSKTSGQVMHLGSEVKKLNENLKEASESSKNLTISIRNATWTAAIVGGLGVLIAAINLIRDIWF
jgi:hypothetical protein